MSRSEHQEPPQEFRPSVIETSSLADAEPLAVEPPARPHESASGAVPPSPGELPRKVAAIAAYDIRPEVPERGNSGQEPPVEPPGTANEASESNEPPKRFDVEQFNDANPDRTERLQANIVLSLSAVGAVASSDFVQRERASGRGVWLEHSTPEGRADIFAQETGSIQVRLTRPHPDAPYMVGEQTDYQYTFTDDGMLRTPIAPTSFEEPFAPTDIPPSTAEVPEAGPESVLIGLNEATYIQGLIMQAVPHEGSYDELAELMASRVVTARQILDLRMGGNNAQADALQDKLPSLDDTRKAADIFDAKVTQHVERRGQAESAFDDVVVGTTGHSADGITVESEVALVPVVERGEPKQKAFVFMEASRALSAREQAQLILEQPYFSPQEAGELKWVCATKMETDAVGLLIGNREMIVSAGDGESVIKIVQDGWYYGGTADLEAAADLLHRSPARVRRAPIFKPAGAGTAETE